jgi:hypothetical protein
MLSELLSRMRVGHRSLLVIGLSLIFAVSARAQITLVHVMSCGPTVPFPATTCSIPSTGNGNLLVVGWASTGGAGATVIASVTDNAGNNYLEAGTARAVDANANDMGDVWYAKNSLPGATVLTITPNPTGTVGTAVIWEFSGVDITAPLDQTAVLSSQAATTAPLGAPITTTSANELVVSTAYVLGAVTGILSGNAFTNDSTATGDGWAHFIASSPGSYSAQWTTDLGTYGSTTVSFKAKSAGGSGVGGSACDLNNDGTVNVVDVQLATNMDLGLMTCTANIEGPGVCNPAVVQLVVNAALGGGCVATIPHSVSLSWTASISPKVAGYNVYRGTTSGGPYSKLNSSLVAATSYTDSAVQAGQSYYYVATAVDTSNNESAYSTPASALIPTP